MTQSETPEELRPPKHHWYNAYKPPLSDQERQAALDDPGPSWTQWATRDFLRWCAFLLFLIIDTWIVESYLYPVFLPGLVIGLLVATYLEFLLYSYLWHRPGDEQIRRRERFQPTWYRPVLYGRWTVEAERAAQGTLRAPEESGPDAREFL